MKILVTGAKGFIGKNLVATLNNIKNGKDKTRSVHIVDIFDYDIDSDLSTLHRYCKETDFVFNLAGVNRPIDQGEYMDGNYRFSLLLLETLRRYNNRCPVMLSSSIQAELENPYGQSKRAGEDLFFDYRNETGAKVLVYRFPNIFGKWCRPNYNSVVATFCHNIANDLPIMINDRSTIVTLVYIDDVVNELLDALEGKEHYEGKFCCVPIIYKTSLGEIADMIYKFKASRSELNIPDMGDSFIKKLYATYMSYLPKDRFAYDLTMKCDHRGSFTEIIRTPDRGQFSVSISKPGIARGNHWHYTKNEKFLVVSGRGVIRLRNVMPGSGNDVIEYYVSGDYLQVVDIPTGYTHNIENLGDTDMVTFMWSNECFNPDKPDTFFQEV